MLKNFKSKIYIAVSLLLFLVSFGTLGFHFVSSYPWVDALYMTVITISTVGYSEVTPLDGSSKLFTVLFIMTSVIVIAYSLSVVTEYIISKNALESIKQRAMKKRIEKLKNHVIVCGFGRNGTQAVHRLGSFKRDFVVVENNQEKLNKYSDILFVQGDANDDSVLIEAGIHRAQYLIAALPHDAANLFLVLSARQLNPNLFIISRAEQASTCDKLTLAGANKVIMPTKIGGDHMASLVVSPDLVTFMDKLATQGDENINLEEIELTHIDNQGETMSLSDLDLRRKTGCSVIGYVTPEGKYIINPEVDIQLEQKGKIIVLGRSEQIHKLNKMFHIVPVT